MSYPSNGPSFSPEAPKSLIRLFRKSGSYQAAADEIGVNVSYVYRALHDGICPANPSIAHKLGFDGKHLRMGDERQKHIRWFKHRLTAQQRNKLIFDWFHYREDEKDGDD